VRGLSTFRISTTHTSSRVTTNTTILALRTMGSRHGRKIAQILARRACLHVGDSRQIYQVGRSSPRNNPRFYSRNQLHQVHSLSLQSTTQHHHNKGTNFTSKEFKNYCESLGIKLKFASVAYPKTNGQVKKANGLFCNGIKKRLLAPLKKAKHAWVDELPSVL
jgi:transposase InsO family protein